MFKKYTYFTVLNKSYGRSCFAIDKVDEEAERMVAAISRRRFCWIAAGALAVLALPGCSSANDGTVVIYCVPKACATSR